MPCLPLCQTNASAPALARRLAGAWAAAGVLAGAASLAAPPLDDEVLAAINRYRQQQLLGLLLPSAHLHAIAADHARDLARQGRLSHGGFAQRMARSGAPLCVENLAAGHRRGDAVLAAWQASSSHHLNLLEPQVREVGIAEVGGFVVMLACETDRP